MTSRAGVPIAAAAALTAFVSSAWTLGAVRSHAPVSSADPDHSPNYADKMESPYEGEDVAPRLVAARTRFPIHVAVVDDGEFFRDRWYTDAVSACSAWASATSGIEGGGLQFVYSRSTSPNDADVVVKFVSREESPEFRGTAKEMNGWALVTVVVRDEAGNPPTDDSVRRLIMHEMGHALGIWGHSPDPNDIMSAKPKSTRISVADVNTLRLAYGI